MKHSLRHMSLRMAASFVCICLFYTASAAFAAQDRVIAIIPPDAPPTYFLDEKTGHAAGFAVDVMDVLAARSGLRVEYVFGKGWKDIIEKIERGEADIAPLMGISEERRKRFAFTSEIDQFPIAFFIHSNTKEKDWSPENRTVGVISGSIAHEKLKSRDKIKFMFYESFETGMHDLLAGKIDAFVCPVPIFLQLAQRSDIEDHFVMVAPPIDTIHRAIAVRKDNTELLDRLNTAMKGFVGSEEYQHIYKKWYGAPSPFWTEGRIIAAGIALIILSVTIMAIWRYLSLMRLNRELNSALSAREHAEMVLGEKESMLLSFLNAVTESALLMDRDGRILTANETLAARLGKTASDIIGRCVYDLIPPELAARRREHFEKVFETGNPVRFEDERNGRFIDNSLYPVFGPDNKVLAVAIIGIDTTERKNAEEKVRLAKEEWERTFDAIADPVMILDTEFRIVRANKAMSDALDVTPDKAIGLTCYESVHGTSKPPVSCPHALLLATGEANTREIYEQRMGGHFLVSVSPIFDAEGKLAGSIHAARNITEIKRAEEILRKTEKKLREITSCQGEGLYVIDKDGLVAFMNPEAERLLGWTESELKGKNIHDIIHSRRPDGSYLSFEDCPMRRVIQTGARFESRDESFISRDGRTFPVSIITAPLYEDGTIVASVTSFLDISGQKKLEQEKELLIVELQKALAEIKTLHGILPICSFCKKIKDDKGAWHQLEAYISDRTDAAFSHGLCMDCAKKYYPEYIKKKQ